MANRDLLRHGHLRLERSPMSREEQQLNTSSLMYNRYPSYFGLDDNKHQASRPKIFYSPSREQANTCCKCFRLREEEKVMVRGLEREIERKIMGFLK